MKFEKDEIVGYKYSDQHPNAHVIIDLYEKEQFCSISVDNYWTDKLMKMYVPFTHLIKKN